MIRSSEARFVMRNWFNIHAADFIDFNPRLSIKKGTLATKIAMDKLQPFTKKIPATEQAVFAGGSKFCNGDTIMARITPCLENGKTAFVDILADGEIAFGSTEFIVMRARKNISDPQFVYYLAISPVFRNVAIKSMVGSSGRQRVQQGVLDELELTVPPIDEQQKIGAFLAMLDKRIEINLKINDNLQQQAVTLYQSWFVDYAPFDGIMPDTWHMGTLSDLADTIICGKTPSTKRSEYYGNEVPFITIPDMHNQIYAVSTERSLSTVGALSQSGKMLSRNSICVSCIGTAGLVCFVAEPSQTNQQINSIVPSPTASPYYIYLLAKTLSDTIQNLGSGGSTICNLNKGQFSTIEALIPSEKSMREFDEIVKPLFETIHINQVENLRLAEIRDTLLPRLMNGEIDVSNIDI